MNVLYTFSAKISDVVKPEGELPPEQNQTFVVNLYDNGTLSLKFYGGESGTTLISRLSIPLKLASAVETFADAGKDYWLLRVQGSQVPLVLSSEEMSKFMDAVDTLA